MSKTEEKDREPASEKVVALGLRIKAERTARGWSRSELALRANVSQPTIANVETASTSTGVDVLYKIADAFQRDLSMLV